MASSADFGLGGVNYLPLDVSGSLLRIYLRWAGVQAYPTWGISNSRDIADIECAVVGGWVCTAHCAETFSKGL